MTEKRTQNEENKARQTELLKRLAASAKDLLSRIDQEKDGGAEDKILAKGRGDLTVRAHGEANNTNYYDFLYGQAVDTVAKIRFATFFLTENEEYQSLNSDIKHGLYAILHEARDTIENLNDALEACNKA